jgi:PP-loop superfamily ATP-utilizing enzyme
VKEMVAAFSGGKDSTAMILLCQPRFLLWTPTGNELPGVQEHIEQTAQKVKAEVIIPPGPTLPQLIAEFNALPNHRMRWCTRMIKIQPAYAWMVEHRDRYKMAVGLRADEEHRQGLFGDDFEYCYPLRDEGVGLEEVWQVIKEAGLTIPRRTDCAVCFHQRLREWYWLWRDYPFHWTQGETWEAQVGYTFRSPSRDTWPASMEGLRSRFEQGDRPRGADNEVDIVERRCRVCSL